MASKSIYTAVAIVGIAAASGAAWWVQRQPQAPEAAKAAASAPASGTGVGGQTGGSTRPPSVEVAKVEILRITDDAQAVGSLRSRQSVMLRPEVPGRVTQINFRDAEKVRRGQVLVQFDDQLPAALLKQAEAELSIARANHRRNAELVEQKFIAQRAVDESAANLQVAEAKLSLAKATLARLRIVAPFDGVAGIRNVSVGDFLKDGADIVNIEDLEAVYVDFRLPERFQTKVRPGQTAMVDLDSLPGQRFGALIQAVDPLLDANGRSIGVRGCIDNRAMQLRPGMFARVTPVFGVRDDAKVIPEEAIVPQGGRQFVYKLVDGPDQDTRIAQRVEVKVGVRQPGKVEIVEGLAAGDTVVTAGQQRIQKDGTPVRVLDLAKAGGAAVAGAGPAPGSAAGGGGSGRKPPPAMEVIQAVAGPGNPCMNFAGAGGRGAPQKNGAGKPAGDGKPAGRPAPAAG